MTKVITLKNLPEATAQEVFDQVKEHLLKQYQKSVTNNINGGLSCLYRGLKGLKCAVGCLIADDEYDKKMEGSNWLALYEDKKVPSEHHNLIIDLQTIHDYSDVGEWKNKLIHTAKTYNLNCVFS